MDNASSPRLSENKKSMQVLILSLIWPGSQKWDQKSLLGVQVRFREDTLLIEPVQKERGIFEIMKKYYLTDEQIVVFGDGMNDCSLFRKKCMPVAMGNRKASLKEKAKYITQNANEDMRHAVISDGFKRNKSESRMREQDTLFCVLIFWFPYYQIVNGINAVIIDKMSHVL